VADLAARLTKLPGPLVCETLRSLRVLEPCEDWESAARLKPATGEDFENFEDSEDFPIERRPGGAVVGGTGSSGLRSSALDSSCPS
jgi:hypothetical protein